MDTAIAKNIMLELEQFHGSETFYRHGLVQHVVYTEGVQHLAERAGAYWLIDEIATSQMLAHIRTEEFQVWVLKLDSDPNQQRFSFAGTRSSATLTCDDGNGKIVYTHRIEFTDFPAPEVKLYFSGNTVLLPSEY